MLRTGKKGKSVIELSRELLDKHTLGMLATVSLSTLMKFEGIGKDKAATLQAAFELGRRIPSRLKWFSETKVTSPQDIADVFIPLLRDELREKFIVVSLNSANKIIKYDVISVGNLNSSIVHPREVFKSAIENTSASIILVHNHPSGNCEPSKEDISITKKLAEAGKLLDIPVFDHIIIAGNEYTSFVDKKLI